MSVLDLGNGLDLYQNLEYLNSKLARGLKIECKEKSQVTYTVVINNLSN